VYQEFVRAMLKWNAAEGVVSEMMLRRRDSDKLLFGCAYHRDHLSEMLRAEHQEEWHEC
jgi:hypothetical protein